MKEWRLTRVNQGWKMSRVEGECVALRNLKWYDYVLNWHKMLIRRLLIHER